MKGKIVVLAAVVAACGVTAGVAVAAASPAVVTGSATAVKTTSATLNGTVNPNGSSTTYYFEWGLTTGYGATGKTLSAGSGTKAVAVDETASGLIPGTDYHYRLVATNRYGTTTGTDRTFKTAGHPPPGVQTGPANGISTNSATLTGTVSPSGAVTTWWFEWGNSPSLGEQTQAQTVSAGAPAQNVSWSLQNLLAPGILYYYRLVASHGGGGAATSYGPTYSFLTWPSPRPVAKISAVTKPGRVRHKPYAFTTLGTIAGPSWMPSSYACAGDVTIRYFSGRREVGFLLAGVQPNCSFGARATFPRLPGRGKVRGPVHLRIVIRYVSTSYLGTNRARYEHVTLG